MTRLQVLALLLSSHDEILLHTHQNDVSPMQFGQNSFLLSLRFLTCKMEGISISKKNNIINNVCKMLSTDSDTIITNKC